MSAESAQISICINSLLDNFFPNTCTVSIPRKRWRLAFLSIFFCRAMNPPSHIAIDIKPANFGIHQTKLTKLVKEKDLQQLRDLGGISGVASAIKTSLESGIDGGYEDIITLRQEAFGCNTYEQQLPAKRFFYYVVESFKDLTSAFLLGCAALSLGCGINQHGLKEGWYESGSIFVASFLVIAVSAISNYTQNRQFNILSKVSNNIEVDVVRGCQRQKVIIFDIVVGDVVCLKIGDPVPADGLFIEGHSLRIEESSMTGEGDHVEINADLNPFLFSGTNVADGYGRMLVISVGMNTAWGETMSHISRDTNEQTPLQTRLHQLTLSMGRASLAIAFLVLIVLLVRYFTGNLHDANDDEKFKGSKAKAAKILNDVVGLVAAAVTIVIVAIPEGLAFAVTFSLAYSIDQAIVRKPSACEIMGSATTICTDKTGTITMKEMEVTKFCFGQMEHSNSSLISSPVLELVSQGVSFNTIGSISSANPDAKQFVFSGSPTEKALLSWAILGLKIDMEEVKRIYTILHFEIFKSEKKRSGVVIKNKLDGTIHVHWKGAAEMILAMCSSYYDASGMMKDLDHHHRKQFKDIIHGMAEKSLRCMAFAHTQISKEQYVEGKREKKLKENSLTLLGIVGLANPCRPEAQKAVKDCQNAGVNIKMITGDNIITAKAIATECGILQPGQDISSGVVIEGEEFRSYKEEERMEKVDKICVLASSSPSDKLLVVQCLKQKGHVVAVASDGTKDAPALKEADIGLSMGIQGSEVAKKSSDIILLDDNFATVVKLLMLGRHVYMNIQKTIQLQLTISVVAIVTNIVAAASAGEIPFTAAKLLWVNLVVDKLSVLALISEKPIKELMAKPPIGRKPPLVTNIMWRNLSAQALYQIVALLILQFKGKSIFGVTEKANQTLVFSTSVLCQVFNIFNARMPEKKNVFHGVHRNKLFCVIISVTIILQVIVVELMKKFADAEKLSWSQWGVSIGLAALTWPIDWVVKSMLVPEEPFFSCLSWMK